MERFVTVTLLLFVVGILKKFLSEQITDELRGWTPWVTSKIVDCAVRKLPERRRKRFREEWHSHLEEIPAELSKLMVALGFLVAAFRMSGVRGNKKHRLTQEDPVLQYLTAREIDVLTLVLNGFSTSEIAVHLHITDHSVKNYLFCVYAKFGVRNRTQLIGLAKQSKSVRG